MVNYEVWDLQDPILDENAAYLWLDITPPDRKPLCLECMVKPSIEAYINQGIPVETPSEVAVILGRIRNHFPDDFYRTRKELRDFAQSLDRRPLFLYPEERVTTSAKAKELSTKERNSYLKLIKGLLKKCNIDPKERGIAKNIEGIIHQTGETLGQDKILAILREVRELSDE